MYPWVLLKTHCPLACLPAVLAQLAGHFYPAHRPLQQTFSLQPSCAVPTN